jgi:8-oxo-dGTP pyrophosphatase MutT (NUDIX family)
MERLDSREVYRNPWMSVREDRVRRLDGTEGVYGVVDKPDFALVLPRDRNGFWLVEQFRYPVQSRAWEFPQGSWRPGESGSPIDLAVAELAQETGLRAAQVEHLGHLHAAYGFATQGFDVFLATGLESGDPDREPTEQDMRHRFVPDDEVITMLRGGAITDAPSVAALTLFQLHERDEATTRRH